MATMTYRAFYDLDAPLARVCGEVVPVPHARPMDDAALPLPPKVVPAAKAMVAHA